MDRIFLGKVRIVLMNFFLGIVRIFLFWLFMGMVVLKVSSMLVVLSISFLFWRFISMCWRMGRVMWWLRVCFGYLWEWWF